MQFGRKLGSKTEIKFFLRD
ncbi:hypothetical protein LINPERPRIM_LOCUS8253 [Linum perenne]